MASKLSSPLPPAGMVSRPRLVAMLDDGIQRPLTLISAPAGSGKTTLLAEWLGLGSVPGPVAWLQLGSGDGDRRRFWTNVLAAAGRAWPALVPLEVPPGGRIEGILRPGLNALGGLDEPLVLVLDDMQLAGSSDVIADLEWLLEHQPPGLRVVASTRSDPPLRLQRLRVTGRVAEIRAAELAFTLPETAELLGPLGLDDEHLELLWRRTEGWPAGLRLAELSLAQEPDRHAFVRGFAGDDRAVADYLITEVIGRLPDATAEFLLRTSVPRRLNGELAEALTGSPGAAAMLRELGQAHGLVSPVPGASGWYRCHPLLAEVLRAELRRRAPEEVAPLHVAAARWHAEHGDPLEAVEHAIEARSWVLAGDLMAEHWLAFLVRGQATVLLELARRIPEEIVRSDAELALASAGLLLETGEHAEADALLARARELAPGLPPRRARRFEVAAAATELHRARLLGDVTGAVAAARQALGESWEQGLALEVRALTLANLGIAEKWAADGESAGEHLQQAAGLALECGNDFVLFLAESYAASVDVGAGRLDQARTRARTAVQLAERRGWTEVGHASIAYVTLAIVHLWRNELAEARQALGRATTAVTGSPEPLLGAYVAQVGARLDALDGEPVRALDRLQAAWARGPLPFFMRVTAGAMEAELWLSLGEPERAWERVREVESEDASDGLLCRARLELAAGDPGAALAAVVSFFGDERAAVVPFARVDAWLLDAIARDAIRDEAGALRSLEHALEIAEPRGYSNIVLRYGAPARSLLRRLIARGTAHRALAEELVAVLDDAVASGSRRGSALLEPLSERELAVLRFLPTMMSNAEIATEMFVSVNTVKTHLKHVYRKLGVVDRRDCVERARELRLLSPGLRSR